MDNYTVLLLKLREKYKDTGIILKDEYLGMIYYHNNEEWEFNECIINDFCNMVDTILDDNEKFNIALCYDYLGYKKKGSNNMEVNCNIPQCKNNKDTKCKLDNIEINLRCDEYNIAGCANFQESNEYQRNFYRIKPISIIENYKYIIFSMNYLGVTDFSESIINDLKELYNEEGKVNVIIDNLLAVGNSDNRFIEMTIDFDKMDITSESWKVYETPKQSDLRKFSSSFYMRKTEVIENSILNSIQQRMILKGIVI